MNKPKLVPGKHYDPAAGWAREPRLPTVVELRSRRMSQETYDRHARELMIFAAGVIVGIFGTVLW